MSVYQKMKLLFKASAEAPMKQLVENNDILIFEQEIAEAETSVKTAKLHLAGIKTEIKLIKDAIEELSESVAARENQTLQVMDKDEELALELAELIAAEEGEQQELERQLKHLQSMETRVGTDLKSAVRKIQRHRQQLGILKANQHSLQANKMFKGYSQGLQGSVKELNDTLDNIKSRQQRSHYQDESELDVENELGNHSINRRLNAAGVETEAHNASKVLERLRSLKSESGA